MPLRRSQGKVRPEPPRAAEIHRLPGVPQSAVTGAERDPKTGRFRRGNQAARRRSAALRRRGRELLLLDPTRCDPWIAPYVTGGRKHLSDLLADLPDGLAASALATAEELASARLIYRGLLALAVGGDKDALREARGWLQQCRQHAVTLHALVGEHAAAGSDDDDPLGWIEASSDSE